MNNPAPFQPSQIPQLTGATDFPVLITRPAGKADNLLAGLDELGIGYTYQPLITTQLMPLRARDIQHLQQAELVIFVSVSAVTCLEQQFDLKSLTQPLLAVGATTASVLERSCGHTVTAPLDQRSEGVLALPQLQNVAGRDIVIVRGNGGRELIKQGLLARGAKVTYVQSYKRVPLPLDGQRLSDQWRQQQIQCIVVTSNEILSLLLQSLPETARPWLAQRQWIMVSQRMAETAVASGIPMTNIFLAASANDQALLEAICQLRRKFHERAQSNAE
ncbi:MAG TPA: uroporphyrinogen-III synthase [Rheinheimera sp.]|uniref:uroporphyrinogen-III synthase n=1 Tax=Rheinheimera sp. TaxID=1869214 RepID=UPI000ECE4C0E|nr:uroporphyrinogen-III synthase [Rheinheimera sp.]HCU64229.1 uroporphyrinogen-III synthase [Rheinheimera sp.]